MKRFLTPVLILLLALSLTACGKTAPAPEAEQLPAEECAEPVEETAEEEFDFEAEWAADYARDLAAAEAGDPEAMVTVATDYHAGVGTEQNLDEAIRWYRKAIDNGVIYCAYMLGNIYEQCEGYIDIDEAIRCYRMNLDLGESDAINYEDCLARYDALVAARGNPG